MACQLVIIANRKSHWLSTGSDVGYLTITLNGIIALILRYFTEFDSFRGRLRQHEDRPVICLQNIVFYFWPKLNSPTLQRGLSTIAELLV